MVQTHNLNEMYFEDCRNNPKHLDYGDTFDGLWGVDVAEVNLKDIEALLTGKVLRFDVNGEYALLLRLKGE